MNTKKTTRHTALALRPIRIHDTVDKGISGPLMQADQPTIGTDTPTETYMRRQDLRRSMGQARMEAYLHWHDTALWQLITRDRDDHAAGRNPDDWYGLGLSGLLPDGPHGQQGQTMNQSLLVLRGKALKLARYELAAYCGISSMTIYRQETTHWETSTKRPNWVYWLTLHKWSIQCWGHMNTYRYELQALTEWCQWYNMPHDEYLTYRDEWLAERIANGARG